MKTLARCDLRQQDSSDVKRGSGVPPSKLLGGAYLEWWLVSIAGIHGQQTSGRGMGTLGGLHRGALPGWAPQGEAFLGKAKAEGGFRRSVHSQLFMEYPMDVSQAEF